MTDSTTTEPATTASTDPAAATTTDTTATTAATTEPAKVEVWQDPDKAKAEIERLRRENGAERTNAKAKAADEARAELAQTIGKALGLVKDDEQADPAKLTEQLAATRAAQRDTAAELIVWRHAADLQVDAAALTDSRAFAAAIKDLDPVSKTFADDVKKAAQEAAEQNPKLKAAPAAAGASTVQHAGGSGEGKVTKGQFDRMTVAQKTALYESDPETYTRLLGI